MSDYKFGGQHYDYCACPVCRKVGGDHYGSCICATARALAVITIAFAFVRSARTWVAVVSLFVRVRSARNLVDIPTGKRLLRNKFKTEPGKNERLKLLSTEFRSVQQHLNRPSRVGKDDLLAPASDLLKPSDARLMRCYPISTRINHVANDAEECSRPVELAEVQNRLFI